MQNLHWDYADSFSGREAAFLISGFDPSSNNFEDTYKVQPVIKKLKKSYYLACAEVIRVTPDDDFMGNFWFWLHKFRYQKEQLLSIEIKSLIESYMSSDFMRQGYPEKLDAAEEAVWGMEFPQRERIAELQIKLEKMNSDRHELEKIAPGLSQRAEKMISEQCESKEGIEDKLVAQAECLEEKTGNDVDLIHLGEALQGLARTADVSLSRNYELVIEELSILESEQEKWEGQKFSTRNAFHAECQPLLDSAKLDGKKWRGDYVHEFDEQSFSREELYRWIKDNELKSAYSFIGRKAHDAVTESLGDTEKNSLLAIVIGMAIKGYSHDPAALRSGTAKEIEEDLKLIGLQVTDDTIRKYLKMAASQLLSKDFKVKK